MDPDPGVECKKDEDGVTETSDPKGLTSSLTLVGTRGALRAIKYLHYE